MKIRISFARICYEVNSAESLNTFSEHVVKYTFQQLRYHVKVQGVWKIKKAIIESQRIR